MKPPCQLSCSSVSFVYIECDEHLWLLPVPLLHSQQTIQNEEQLDLKANHIATGCGAPLFVTFPDFNIVARDQNNCTLETKKCKSPIECKPAIECKSIPSQSAFECKSPSKLLKIPAASFSKAPAALAAACTSCAAFFPADSAASAAEILSNSWGVEEELVTWPNDLYRQTID